MATLRFVLVLALLVPARLSAQDAQPPDEPSGPVLTRAPELLSSVDPDYPEAQQDEGVGGAVVVRIVIDEAGIVTSTELVSGVREDLDATAAFFADLQPAACPTPWATCARRRPRSRPCSGGWRRSGSRRWRPSTRRGSGPWATSSARAWTPKRT